MKGSGKLPILIASSLLLYYLSWWYGDHCPMCIRVHVRFSWIMATESGQLIFRGPTFDNREACRLCRKTCHTKWRPPQKKSWIFDRSTLSSLKRNVYAKCQWHANKTNTSLSVGGHHDHDVDQWERVNVKTPFTSTTRLLDNWCQLLINLFNDSTTSAWKATTTSVKNEIAK